MHALWRVSASSGAAAPLGCVTLLLICRYVESMLYDSFNAFFYIRLVTFLPFLGSIFRNGWPARTPRGLQSR